MAFRPSGRPESSNEPRGPDGSHMPSTHLPHRRGAASAEPMADTWAVASAAPKPAGGGEACLVQISPPGPAMGVRHPLVEVVAVLGRGPESDIRADDPTVSRQHARVVWR